MGVKKLPSGKYQIDWRDEFNVRQRETLGFNYKQAKDILAKKITNRAEKRGLDVKPGDTVAFHDLCDRYFEKHAKIKKASWKRDEGKIKLYKAFFGNPKIGHITKERCEDYAIARHKMVQGPTVNNEMDILKRIFRYAVDHDLLEVNPVSRWEKYPENPARERYLLHGEYLELLASVERLIGQVGKAWRRKLHIVHFRYLIPIAYEAGARREEAVLLKWDDVNFHAGQIRFWYRKGRNHELKSRWVPMSERIRNLLVSLTRNPDTPYLFPDEGGGMWKSKISFYRQWENIVNDAKLKDCTYHTLRHSFCTHLAMNGVDESTRMRLMGHTNPITQQRYTHIADEHKKKAAKVFDDLNGNSLDTFWTLGKDSTETPKQPVLKSASEFNPN
jgi:integrase